MDRHLVVCVVVSACAAMTAVACRSDTPVDPSPNCGGSSSSIGTPVTGFELDRSGLIDGLGLQLRVGERARIRLSVGKPSLYNTCQQSSRFVYMMWTWNSVAPSGDQPREPQVGPIDVTIGSCRCTLFAEPRWTVSLTGGRPQWEQRAWLDGEQSVELEVRGVLPGSTNVFVTGFAGPPHPTPPIDYSLYQSHLLVATVTP